MKKSEKYLTTQEFANLLGISKHTLFYYDKIDLFKPSIVDENGFRYYNIYQYDELDTIIALRNLGLSVDEVKKYYLHKSIHAQYKLIEDQVKKISSKIEKLKNMKKDLEITKWDLDEALENLGQIKILDQDEEYFIISDKFNAPSFYSYTVQIENLLRENKDIPIESNLGCIFKKENALKGDYDNELIGYLKCIHKRKDAYIKPKGKYLVYFYQGDPKTLYKAYEEIREYIKANNLHTSDYFLEELIVGEWCETSRDKYISKVAIQILD